MISSEPTRVDAPVSDARPRGASPPSRQQTRPEGPAAEEEGAGAHFYGVLLYTILFYSRLPERIPVLGAIRIEFVLGAILVVSSLRKLMRGESPSVGSRLNLLALLFFVNAMLSVPFAFVKQRALDMFIEFAKAFMIYIMIVTAVDSERKLKTFLTVYLSMIALLFVEPFLLTLQGKGLVYNNHMMRLAGTTKYFGHPNQLGGITAENLPFFFYWMRTVSSKLTKGVLLLLMGIALRVIMLTQSRTAFLGLLAVALFVWLFSKRKVPSFLVLSVCAVLVWNFAPDTTKARFLSIAQAPAVVSFEETDFSNDETAAMGSMASRWELIRRGLIGFAENPIMGLGLNCFVSFNGHRWGHWFPPHNTYIQALAELGLVGTTIFALVLLAIVRNLKTASRLLEQSGAEKPFLAAMCRAVTVYLMARIVVGFFGQDLYANYWWVAGALSLVILRTVSAEVHSGGGSDAAPGRETEPLAGLGRG